MRSRGRLFGGMSISVSLDFDFESPGRSDSGRECR